MIEIIPAIDIIGGRCVRLTRGDYDTKKEYGDPVALASGFEQLGFRRLHIVDLDGAKSRHVVNLSVLQAITSRTKLVVDFGGGVKSDDDIKRVFDSGAAMVTVGSIAVTRPDTCLGWLHTYGAERIILGADVRGGFISTNGWLEESAVTLQDFLSKYLKAGVRHVLCTDISRDGTLQGPATELYAQVMKTHPQCRLIASGGVRSLDDIEALERAGVPAVVFGKAIYEGTINLKELIARCLPKE